MLAHTIPFLYLSSTAQASLADRMELRRYAPDDWIVRAGERSREVFLLADGEVGFRSDGVQASVLQPGHFFGERAALFDAPRQQGGQAIGVVHLYVLSAVDFLRLIEENPPFRVSLARSLTVKQGIFQGYRSLWAEILRLVDSEGFLLSELVAHYCALHPALHPLLHSDRIDTDALSYAVARLPEDVTRTNTWFLTAHLSPLYTDPDTKFDPLRTHARRRSAWRQMPGKTLILLRDGISDITDLLTCLCAYAVEARKIRLRCRSSEMLVALKGRQGSEDSALVALSGLTEPELSALRRIWPDDLWDRIHDILLHHEDIALDCDFQIDNYNASAAERWAREIRDVACWLVDLEDPELRVHIVSSNTHSVGNCLSAYIARRREEILAWGREHRPADVEGSWADESDLLYVLARHYIEATPGARETCIAEEREAGHYRLRTTAFTGIAVDIIDAMQIEPTCCDPAIHVSTPQAPTLIVNVDYAFGQQAEEILSNLLFVFGHAVRSVSVIGKAGGLTGKRGDLMVPRATLLQEGDALHPLPNADLDVARLAALAPGRTVHEGPVLTVTGTLLQNRQLLHFYRRFWQCVGLEMEGSFFARTLVAAMNAGIVRPDVATRFAYYTSDVPLDPDSTLSEALSPSEGVPPLYAITRGVLGQI
ncbi:MAG: hypothetical protein ACI8RZ_001818, partial [Myxococcota bacterium]